VSIDLHVHTSASDGTCSAVEILRAAVNLNLRAVAITDHDTVEGVKDALSAGIPPGLGFLTGVEISAAPPPGFSISATVHILGYDIDVDHPDLNRILSLLQNARRNRNPKILKKLKKLNMDITETEIRKAAAGDQVGRPHIARVLVEKKYAASLDDAFDRFLGRGKPAYVDKFRIGCKEAVALIQSAGGLPVLAHPALLNLRDEALLETVVVHLKKNGMKGLEVYYPEHSPSQTAFYARLARRYHLWVTGGTDFHGDLKPEIRLGCGRGDFAVPDSLFEEIVKRRWK